MRHQVNALAVAVVSQTAFLAGCERGTGAQSLAESCHDRLSDNVAGYHISVPGGQRAPCAIRLLHDSIILAVDSGGNTNDVRTPVVLTGSGQFAARGSIPDNLSIWNADGTLARSIGSRGAGPGEFTAVSALYVDRTDTIHVSDSPGRWHVYDRRFQYVRSINFPMQRWDGTAFLADGNVLVSRPSDLPQDSLFYVIDRDGRPIRSFGRARFAGDIRRISYSGGSGFWAVAPTRYLLEYWSLDGHLLATIRRRVPFFRDSDKGASWDMESGDPVVLFLHHDGRGRVWVVIADPDGGAGGTPTWYLEAFETVTGRLSVSARYTDPSGLPAGFLADGRVYTGRILPNGLSTAVVRSIGIAAADRR
jgi:hypothetical protein